MTTVEHAGYIAEVAIDEESGWLHASTLGMLDVVNAEAETFSQLKEEFAISIEEYLAFCKELDREPEKPYSGKFQLRTDPTLHRRAAALAKQQGKSLNTFVNDAIIDTIRKIAPETAI
ncbi:MAG: type II toxin-antitoxin system HicB family antitoxin [Cyanobacteria bacterium J06639_1]